MDPLPHATAVGSLPSREVPEAARLLAASMGNNPLHRQVFGNDAARLEPLLYAGFHRILRQQMDTGRVLGLHETRKLVAVAGMFAPGHCLPNLRDKLMLLPVLLRTGALHCAPRIRTWLRIWSHHDPAFAHWHLGPAAVAGDRQGLGFGSRLLQAIGRHLDNHQACGYLETDKPANVRLYQRFGFNIQATQNILGVTNWFMLRQPAPAVAEDAAP